MKLQQRFLSRSGLSGVMLAPVTYPTGTVNILFLRVDFQPDSDSRTYGSGEWSESQYAFNGSSDYWVDRAKSKFVDYWAEVSYGMLPIHVDVTPQVFRLSNTMAHYGTETIAAVQNLIYDSVVTAQTDTSIVFSQYDAVLIIHAGVGEETDQFGVSYNDIWSLYYQGGSGGICRDAIPSSGSCLTTVLRDGKSLNEAIIMPQTDSRTGLTVDPLGVYVHEFGHWLGLPDLYCTAYICELDGAGDWSLMGSGSYNIDPAEPTWYGSSPAHLDAWSLAFLGWISPQTVSTTTGNLSVSMSPVETVPPPSSPAAGTSVYRARASSGTGQQYFLVENRQNIGYDAGLPGHGLLIWLVDEDMIGSTDCSSGAGSNFCMNTMENDASRPALKLIEADGDWSLLNTESGSDWGGPGDPFPGSGSANNPDRALTPLTDPSSIPYTDYGWVNVRNIFESWNIVTFDIGYGPLPPSNLTVQRDSGTMAWTASPSGSTASYAIYKNGEMQQAYGTTVYTSFTDGAYLTTDVFAVVAVDGYGNVSQPVFLTPVLDVNPTSITFGDANTSETVTVTNSGAADAVIDSIILSGPNKADFSVSGTCGASVASGSSCALIVAFSPSGNGIRTAVLTLATNDAAHPELTVDLTGAKSGASASAGGGGCFIATAAYGSYLDPHVNILKHFRDRFLLTTGPGRSFVSFYYRHSPPLADYIRRHDWLRTGTRWLLTPIIFAVGSPITALLMVFGMGGIVLERRVRRT